MTWWTLWVSLVIAPLQLDAQPGANLSGSDVENLNFRSRHQGNLEHTVSGLQKVLQWTKHGALCLRRPGLAALDPTACLAVKFKSPTKEENGLTHHCRNYIFHMNPTPGHVSPRSVGRPSRPLSASKLRWSWGAWPDLGDGHGKRQRPRSSNSKQF